MYLSLLSRADQPLIQCIPAGLSSTVACLDITNNLSITETYNAIKDTCKMLLDDK